LACEHQAGFSNIYRWWPLIYLLIVGGILWLGFADRAYDDPFITYRYANNIARGEGFVYNPGERVLSTTTPLFALLLAIPSLADIDIHMVATGMGALSLAVGTLFIWDLSRTWGTPLVGWAALLLYPTFPLLVATVGSETPIYLALCLGGFAYYAKGRYWLAALCVGLAILARPDGVLVALLLAIDFIIRRPAPVPWGAATLFSGITLTWVLFAWIYYGSPIPVTLLVSNARERWQSASNLPLVSFLSWEVIPVGIICWRMSGATWPGLLVSTTAGVDFVVRMDRFIFCEFFTPGSEPLFLVL
jgi:hypothetical protein